MKKSVLIQHGKAHEIWPCAKSKLKGRYHPGFLADVVETTKDVEVGHLWDGKAFSPPPAEDPTPSIRAERDRLLSACDWTQLPDAQVDREAWAAYRRALRDVPAQPGFPASVTWPEKPQG